MTQIQSHYRTFLTGGIFLSCTILMVFYTTDNISTSESLLLKSEEVQEYLVSTSKCKIPNRQPFEEEAKNFFEAEEYIACRSKPLLTFVTKSDNVATLHINAAVASKYTKYNISCCYSYITRKKSKFNPDNAMKITDCVHFKDKVVMFEDFVMVKCHESLTGRKIYENTHAAITVNDKVKNKINFFKNKKNKPFGVLFVGIDGVSRLNLIRSLPLTVNFLEQNQWLSLEGYNKIGDNTFPNVMAILGGFNETYANAICDPTKLGGLDNCPLIWYEYRNLQYITASAEDQTVLSTFNYLKKGFINPPTDYYFRPYFVASEKLHKVWVEGMAYCTGPETAGERILNIARDFVFLFKDFPTFSFFWMNSFSHNALNTVSMMDKQITIFLEEVRSSGILNNTFVIFLSDHGTRFGSFRLTTMGWLEERLPFIYISVPERFKKQFSVEYENLKKKKNQLTNPYDIYMTLQHILVLSKVDYKMKPSNGCPKCKSLFMEHENDRSCEDAAIEQHWCTCNDYRPLNNSDHIVKEGAVYILQEIHKIIQAKDEENKCARFHLNQIISSSISQTPFYKSVAHLVVTIKTSPEAVFEATLAYANDKKNNFALEGTISRLDWYKEHSECTSDLKKYCYCKSKASTPVASF